MQIRRFRHFSRMRCHWVFALGIGLFWAWLSFGYGWGGSWETDEGNVRYVERELVFLEAGKDGGTFLEWWTGQDEREKTTKQLLKVLEGVWETERVIELREHLRGEKELPLSEEAKKAQLRRSFVVGIPYLLAMMGGLFVIWVGRKNWREGGPRWCLTRDWSVALVLVVFFLGEFVGEFCIYPSVGLFVLLFADPYWGDIWASFVWRSAGPIVAAFALIGSWSGIGRVFGLGEAVRWRAVLAVFCVLSLFEWLRQVAGASSVEIDPGDFLLDVNPDGWILFSDVLKSVVFAPIFEELMFRGVLFICLMRQLGGLKAALLSSLIFALVHTQYDAWEMASVGVFGLGCCWLTWRTGSLKPGIALHMLYNGLITLDVFLLYKAPWVFW
jgi:membrane protease YdiL (CAAX protease family)